MTKTLIAFALAACLLNAEIKTPAEAKIDAALSALKADPKAVASLNELALGYWKRARETGDPSFYDKSEAAAKRTLAVTPNEYEAGKILAMDALGRHDFARALTDATASNKRVPDDLASWALLVDANVAIGNFAEAERDAQWILDLRRSSFLGFKKAAELRVWFGDLEGAVEFFQEALRRLPSGDIEENAWVLTEEAQAWIGLGNLPQAAQLLTNALQMEPDYHPAVLATARLRLREGKFEEAAALFLKRYEASKDTSLLYHYASALEKAGHQAEAANAWKCFASEADARSTTPHNANRELALYEAEIPAKVEAAVALAKREVETRPEPYLLDAYAWALYRGGQIDAARKEIKRALEPGLKDADLFCHAARILTDPAFAESAAKLGGSCPASTAAPRRQAGD